MLLLKTKKTKFSTSMITWTYPRFWEKSWINATTESIHNSLNKYQKPFEKLLIEYSRDTENVRLLPSAQCFFSASYQTILYINWSINLWRTIYICLLFMCDVFNYFPCFLFNVTCIRNNSYVYLCPLFVYKFAQNFNVIYWFIYAIQ